MKKLKIIVILSIIFQYYAYGIYLKDYPTTITQPDGTVIECFTTGDEYYNWLHDKDGYTIVQDEITGYYCYAVLNGEKLIASQYVVGVVLPQSTGIQPYINISGEKILERRNAILQYRAQREAPQPSGSRGTAWTGTLNNIVIYIRLADQSEFPAQQGTIYTPRLNTNTTSMRNYFKEVSYNQLDIVSRFFPIPTNNNGANILSYQDSHNIGYYLPYNATTNPEGYISYGQMAEREYDLLYNAINYVKSLNQIPSNLNLDLDGNGRVDNICFIVRGAISTFWPHKGSLAYNKHNVSINGKRVWNYNIYTEDFFKSTTYDRSYSIICHEMCHSLEFPDLYHYNYDKMEPVGYWDIMEYDWNPSQHMGAYMKYKYGGWIPAIPSITTPGTYTLQPLTSASNNCYKIPIQGSSEYLVLEYRKKAGTFENTLPGSGLIIYRINESHYPNGNEYGIGPGGVKDEVYIFRPGGTVNSKGNIDNAHFSNNVGRTTFSSSTNPACFTSTNGSCGHLSIKNIKENSNNTLSFDVSFCVNNSVTFSNTSNLPVFTNASKIQTSGTVTVKSTDNVTFEIGDEVNLGPGFEIQAGGTFEIKINGCANNK